MSETKPYVVQIEEVIFNSVVVYAESMGDAEEKAYEMYVDGGISMDSADCDVTTKALKECAKDDLRFYKTYK